MKEKLFYLKLYLKYDNRVILWLKNIKQGLTNLLKWFPIIWRDRDWDEYYLLTLIEFKLQEMSKLHKKGTLEKSKDVSCELEYLSNLIDRINNHDYQCERTREISNKIDIEFYDGKINTGLTESERKELSNLMKKNHSTRQEDLDELFLLMRKDIERWWD